MRLPELADALAQLGFPAYFRVDLGARKHWHLEVAGRDAFIGVFATLSNLLERRNLLTQGFDPALGLPFDVEMRPLAPLVLGVDWRF